MTLDEVKTRLREFMEWHSKRYEICHELTDKARAEAFEEALELLEDVEE